MAILKKQGKCSNCGGALLAGAEVSWKQITLNHRHGGNGTVSHTSKSWAPVHTSVLQCELGVNSHAEVVAVYQGKVAKLKRQAEKFAQEGDNEMTEFAYKQVQWAEDELAKVGGRP